MGNWLPAELLRQAARSAERQGYEIFWLTESSTGMGKDVSSQLASVALSTSTIRVGTGIMPIYTRTPTLIAEVATSLDEISGGRFTLGLGAGHGNNLAAAHGIRVERPLRRMRECVAILREALSTGRATFHGELFDIPDLELLLPNPDRRLPIYIGVLRPGLAQLAGEIADGVILNMVTPDYLQEVVPLVRAAAEQAGREPDEVDIACLVLACADDREAERVCSERIANYHTMPFYQEHMKRSGFATEVEAITAGLRRGGLAEGARAVSPRMLETLALVGDPKTWPEKISRYGEAGIGLPCLFLFPAENDEAGSVLRGVEALQG